MHSPFWGMCCGARIDLWRGRTLAGALGSVVITGHTRPRENSRRTKKARRRIQKNVTLFFVTPMCRKHKNTLQNCETLYKMSVSERGCEDFNSRCVFFRNEKMCFSIGFSKVLRMSGVCYYSVTKNERSRPLYFRTSGSGFIVPDSVSGPIGVTKNKVTFFRIVVLQCSWSVRNDVVAGGFLLGSGYCRGNSWRLPENVLL